MWLSWRRRNEPRDTPDAYRFVGRAQLEGYRFALADGDVVPQAGYRRYADMLPRVDDSPLMTPGQAARSDHAMPYQRSYPAIQRTGAPAMSDDLRCDVPGITLRRNELGGISVLRGSSLLGWVHSDDRGFRAYRPTLRAGHSEGNLLGSAGALTDAVWLIVNASPA